MANTSILVAFERMWQHVVSALSGKSDISHSHDDMYYTESEIDNKVSAINTSITNTTNTKLAEAKKYTDEALVTANEYTDNKTADLASVSVVDNKISTHNTSTSAHNDIRVLISDLTTKLNNFLDVDDTTSDQLSEIITMIENNKGTLESLTTSKINVSDIVNNLTTNSTGKVLSGAQGVAIKGLIDALQTELDSHTHAIADVSGLQTALDAKQATVTGAATTITSSNLTASRALVSDSSGKIAVSAVTSTELGYLDGVASNIQTQIDSKLNSSKIIYHNSTTSLPTVTNGAILIAYDA